MTRGHSRSLALLITADGGGSNGSRLRLLNRARTLNDLRVPPGNRLEALKGGREGQFSIRINDQYRICFRWEDGDAYDVELTDYH